MFRLPQPKALFMYQPDDVDFYESVLKVVLPLAKRYLGKIKVIHVQVVTDD
jgi:hypothetical protein